jgi:UDP-4-amino-4-deoxy-L-arabinose formyltransferase/UDP-glucuronic acid dehydrogenase (UDP-4-keto-hexauronic acid decarboxylating)
VRLAVIGRTEVLLDAAQLAVENGHEISCVVSAKEAPEYKKSVQDFKNFAENCAVPFVETSKIDAALAVIAESRSDIAVSMNFPTVISQTVIDHFPLGILNLHGGDLPRYRGNACQAWALINGEREIGLCVHKMIGGELDSGDLIGRDYLAIDHTTKIAEVLHWINLVGPSLMVRAVEQLGSHSDFILEAQSKDPERGLRCYPRHPSDGRIDWTQSSIQILRLINASSEPYQGAFSELEGNHISIWRAELLTDEERFCAVPGQVVRIGSDFVDVACGTGKLRLLDVEVSGRRGAPSDTVRSTRQRLV